MISTRNFLFLSLISCIYSPLNAATNIADYNYSPDISSKDTGVDIQALVECGYDYGTGNCKGGTGTQSGYGDSTGIQVGANAARTYNKDGSIADSSVNQNLGIKRMDDNSSIVSKSDTNSLNKQKSTIDSIYGTQSTNLTSTYNTNVIPNAQGSAFKAQCMSYSDAQLESMANSSNKDTVSLANQCIVVRTVANANDSATISHLSSTDPLRASVTNRAKSNNTTNGKVANVKANDPASASSANAASYACDLSPDTTVNFNKTCNIRTYSRQQTCSQNLSVVCKDSETGLVVDDAKNYCGFDAGVDVTQYSGNVQFDEANKTIWLGGEGGTHRFFVKNKDIAVENIARFIAVEVAGWKSGNRVYFNGNEIFKGKGTNYGSWDYTGLVREGWNELNVGGGGNLKMQVPYPTIKKNCKIICKEQWTNSCTIDRAYNKGN